MMPKEKTGKKKPSPILYWYLLPILLGIIGGIIGYLIIRKTDKEFAHRLLMTGAIVVVISITVGIFVIDRAFEPVTRPTAATQPDIELVGSDCQTGYYLLTVRSLADYKFPGSLVKVEVDGVMPDSVFWSPDPLVPDQTSVAAVYHPSAGVAGTSHRISIIPGASEPIYTNITC